MDFPDLEAFQALPRLSTLALSPDGSRLVASVATLDPKKQRWVNALWEIDPTGRQQARRLTRSAKGEAGATFTEAGDLLFTSGRPDSETAEDPDKPKLWLLPTVGEARPIGSRPGGVGGARTRGDVVVVASDTLPESKTEEQDAAARKDREERKVSAILHTGYPVRYWDHDLGPGAPRLLVGSLSQEPVRWRDLTPTPGRSLDEAGYALTPDGTRVITTWSVAEPFGARRSTLVVLDTSTGERRVLADGPQHEWASPKASPDGTRVATIRNTRSTASDPGDNHVVVLGLDDGSEQLVEGWDRWPTQVEWAGPDALLVIADEGGRAPVFRIDLTDLRVTRLTTGDGAFTDLCVTPDGSDAYALRAGYDGPSAPVRIDPRVPGEPTRLLSPVPALELPGTLTEVATTVADGREVRAWLALPAGDGPHPLVLWVHGGPLSSWNSWSWRWCPWLLVAQGYAVLLPDPALSTGYGMDQIKAGWGSWGPPTFADLMTITDVALKRPDLDADRTAMMGGSFGGYMANWIAGHTERFGAIVSHASLWDLERFGPTTDASWYWAREMTPEMVAANNPARFADAIVTPMLVIHGDKDYRVPIGEALSLWWDLCSRAEDPETMKHRFLYFPDENHWVLTPQNARAWYDAVLTFLADHV